MNDQAPQRGAPLPGRTHRRECDGAHGQIEIGGRTYDCGIIAAQFEKRLSEARGDARRNCAAHNG